MGGAMERLRDEMSDGVVDADFHMTEQMDDIGPYLPDRWHHLLTGGGRFDGFYDPTPDSGVIPVHILSGRAQTHRSNAVRMTEDVYDGMELFGTDAAFVTPGDVILDLGMVHHEELATALASAYNEFYLTEVADDLFYGAIAIAGQQPKMAAEEIETHADDSAVAAAYLPVGGLNPPLGHERYAPIYEACERYDLPLVMHSTASAPMMSFPRQFEGLNRAMSNHAIAHPFQHAANAVSMVTNGIPELYDVDFVFQEAGLGWVPYFMHRLDGEYFAQREDAPLLEKPPSDYMRDEFYYTSQPMEGLQTSPEYVCSTARHMGGAESLLWASDYPHHDFDHLDAIVQALNKEFSIKELADIFGGTAREVLRA